jgi:4,4'-diaponeurosporenoate glycosyltransferase
MTLLLIALALGLLGFVILWRIPQCDPADEGAADQLSLIIPARNEAHNLPALLGSIRAQSTQPGEVLVVDDGSTDGTAEVAKSFGARVIASKPLPEGWGGKTWACQQGADAAAGRLLLFVDADTWFEPGGLGRILSTHARRGGVLSTGPYHVVHKAHEQLSAFFNLIMTAGIGSFTLLGDRLPPRGLFGQMLLVPRTDYFAAGGHAAVKGRNLENFCLAEEFRKLGLPLHCAGGRGVFSFRMYPQGLREVVDGWTKGFAAGAGQTPFPLLMLIICWISGLFTAAMHLPGALMEPGNGLAGYWIALYAALAGQVYFQLRRVGTFHWSAALLYPVCLIFYFLVFTRSLLRNRLGKRNTWKGRTFTAR